jgi:hypothetical protein
LAAFKNTDSVLEPQVQFTIYSVGSGNKPIWKVSRGGWFLGTLKFGNLGFSDAVDEKIGFLFCFFF